MPKTARSKTYATTTNRLASKLIDKFKLGKSEATNIASFTMIWLRERNRRDRCFIRVLSDYYPRGMPSITFIAQDKYLLGILHMYVQRLRRGGANAEKIAGIHAHITAIEKWQKRNPDKVKLPD